MSQAEGFYSFCVYGCKVIKLCHQAFPPQAALNNKKTNKREKIKTTKVEEMDPPEWL